MKLVISTFLSLLALHPLSAQTISIARSGTQASQQGPAANFTGSVRVDPLFQPTGSNRASGSLVTFDAGAHSAWHTHPTGQVLIVTAGTGRVQQWGQPMDEIRVGDVVRIPPDVKHWHGAAPATSMAHISVVEQPATGPAVVWMEKVRPEQYDAPVRDARPAAATNEPPAAQRIMGDITDARRLSPTACSSARCGRARSSRNATAASSRSERSSRWSPDQFRSHLARARTNGVTQEEAIEAITHLAFYSGW